MPDERGALSIGPGAGATIEGPVGGPLTFKARGEQTGGALTVLENTIAPLEGPPLHAHASEDEAWYVLEGRLRFKLDGEIRDAPADSFVFVPRGLPHCFQNIGSEPARILVMFTPAGMERFFDRFARLPEGAVASDAFRTIGHGWAWRCSVRRWPSPIPCSAWAPLPGTTVPTGSAG